MPLKEHNPLDPQYQFETISGDFINYSYKLKQNEKNPELSHNKSMLLRRIAILENTDGYQKLAKEEKDKLDEIKQSLTKNSMLSQL